MGRKMIVRNPLNCTYKIETENKLLPSTYILKHLKDENPQKKTTNHEL
jgi:hypothetical protein